MRPARSAPKGRSKVRPGLLGLSLALLLSAGQAWPAAAGHQIRSDEVPLVRLAVLGDVGTGDANEWDTAGLVTEAGAADPFDALVLLGDNVYQDGDPARIDATVFDPFDEVLSSGAALLPVLGNHDILEGHGPGQMERLGMPGRWYTARVGPVLVLGLDSNLADDPGQLRWLEEALRHADAAWIFAVMHHPPYSAGVHGSSLDVQMAWSPLFSRYGVDIAFAGHDHDYQRSIPIDGVTYVVSGGAAKLRPSGSAWFTAHSDSVHHFVDVSVWPDRIELRAVGHDGVFDTVTIAATDRSAATGRPLLLPGLA